MPLHSVGAAATSALMEFLTEREKSRQQDLMNAHVVTQDRLDREKETREAQTAQDEHAYKMAALDENQRNKRDQLDEKRRADLVNRYNTGDIPTDPGDISDITRLGLGEVMDPNAQGPPAPGQVAPNKAIRFSGSAAQRQRAADTARTQAYMDSLPPDSPERRAAEYERATGHQPATGLIVPKVAAPETEPVYVVDPVKGTLKKIGDAPKGSHFNTTPQPSAAAANPDLEPETVDMLARAYALGDTQRLTGLGWGTASAPKRTAVMNRAQKFNPDTGQFDAAHPPNLAALGQDFKANQAALTANEKALSSLESFADTAKANKAMFDAMKAKIPDAPIALANTPWRWINDKLGNTAMADFKAIRESLLLEYGKLISAAGSMGGRELSVGMQKSMNTILDDSATVPQLEHALDTLAQESTNRHRAYQDQSEKLRSRFEPKDTLRMNLAPGDAAGRVASPANETPAQMIERVRKGGR